jgi:hypothetical protein
MNVRLTLHGGPRVIEADLDLGPFPLPARTLRLGPYDCSVIDTVMTPGDEPWKHDVEVVLVTDAWTRNAQLDQVYLDIEQAAHTITNVSVWPDPCACCLCMPRFYDVTSHGGAA